MFLVGLAVVSVNMSCLQEFPETDATETVTLLYLLNSTTATAPDSINDLGLWFKADALSASSGAAISNWTDSSGYDRHALNANGSSQPTYQANVLNGQPALYFDGNDDFLQSPYDIEYKTVTYLAVARFTKNWNPGWGAFGHRMYIMSQFGDFPENASGLFFNWAEVAGAGKSRISLRVTVEGIGNVQAGTDSNQNEWYLLSGQYDGDYVRLYSSGTLIDQSGLNAGDIRNASIGFDIARHLATTGGSDTHRFGGYIAEIILYTRSLTDSERRGVECYLGLKYNLSAGDGCE